eukprot:gnl/TRDRNA2_/TRDRNA2_175125_c1_seq9.p1 gnl/TRDRNA2_/TRDRNA2_175125_c1~~gnl/TRDRNA2_/TRDRNA2_175125_c1_seq9.p1  ORF type:complete len:275 (+),score=20.50 gnl/TRDRNA2_/TRDRNA2_175125_c1_seq9:47-871(+)
MIRADHFLILLSLHFTSASAIRLLTNPSVPVVQQPLKFNGRPLRVACIGDSITQGHTQGRSRKSTIPPSKSYPSQLQKLLGNGYEVQNFGVSGARVLRKCGNIPAKEMRKHAYFLMEKYHEALAFLPDIAVVQLGTNDAQNRFLPCFNAFERDYGVMIDMLRNLSSQPEVHIMVPPPLFMDGFHGLNQTVIQNVLPPLVRKIATTKGLPPPIDNFKSFTMQCPSYSKNVGRKSYMYDRRDCKLIYDGCHPTAIGYTKIAELVHEAIINSNRTFH